jgi:mono/diheme cytochrome c family protein
MSFSPETGLVYIPATETYGIFAQDDNYKPNPGGFNLGVAFGGAPGQEVANPDTPRGTTGRLIAWNPVTMEEVWRSEAFPTFGGGFQMTGGVASTAGNVVFQGNNGNKEFAAYRATDGEKLWSFDAKTGIMASPITYEVDGEQYVAVAAGGVATGGYYAPNGARLLVFKLGATGEAPDVPEFEPLPFVDLPQFASAEVVAHGEEAFRNNCALCHGQGGAARSTFPDLRRSEAVTDQALFDAVVLEGLKSANGMASFDDRLDPPDTEAIRAYLIDIAATARVAAAEAAAAAAAAEAEIHEDPNAGSPE